MVYPKSTRGRGAGFGIAWSEVVTKASKMKLLMSLIVVNLFSIDGYLFKKLRTRERKRFQKHAVLRECRRTEAAKGSNGSHRVVRQLADVLKHMY